MTPTKEAATPQKYHVDLGPRAPYWAHQLAEGINWLLEAARADAFRDVVIGEEIMALEDDILAQLDAANTKQDGFLVILNQLKANQNNPAKLQAIAKSIGEQQGDWEAAFNNVSEPEPPFEESGN